MTDPTPLDPATLAAIRRRDDERTFTYGSGWGAAAAADRRVLLAQVDRLGEALAATEAALVAERAAKAHSTSTGLTGATDD